MEEQQKNVERPADRALSQSAALGPGRKSKHPWSVPGPPALAEAPSDKEVSSLGGNCFHL